MTSRNYNSMSPEDAMAEAGVLPEIVVNDKHLPSLTDKSFKALALANIPPRYFQRGGILVQLEKKDGPFFREINGDRLRGILARVARWVKRLERGSVPVFPLSEVVRDMLNLIDSPLPRVDFIASSPILTPQWDILEKPGFHEKNNAYLNIETTIPPVPDNPTEEDVRTARELIFEMICDFPFESDADRAHAVALLLLPFVRPAIMGPTPLHDMDAPSAGTGKGLLTEVLLYPGTGQFTKIDTLPRNEDELRKKITSSLIEGRPVISFDNIKFVVDSGVLAAVLTATVWTDRMLGSTRMVQAPVTSIWVITGNNVRLSGEITRRTVRSRMDARVEHPEDRKDFRHPDLRAWTRENRGRLINAALVLVRRWLIDGRPKPEMILGSYESWSYIVGGILRSAGISGFLKDREKLREESDAENGAWRAFISAWWGQHGLTPVKTSDLISLADEVEGFPLGPGNEHSRKTTLGRRLREQRNRIIGGHQILSSGTGHGGAALWRLVDRETTPPSPPTPSEQDRSTFSYGGVLVGLDSTPHKSMATQPRENCSGPSFCEHGGVGGVKTQPLAGKNIPDIDELLKGVE